MEHITGFKKAAIILSRMFLTVVGKLPLPIIWYLFRTFRNEKLTKWQGRYIINTFVPPFPSFAFERLI